MEPFSCPQDGPHLYLLCENGSTVLVEPKRFHSGAKTAPLSEKWYLFQPFFFGENYGKRLHCGTVLANGTTLVRGTVFFSNMIIKEKNGSSGAVFKSGGSHFGSTFFQCFIPLHSVPFHPNINPHPWLQKNLLIHRRRGPHGPQKLCSVV